MCGFYVFSFLVGFFVDWDFGNGVWGRIWMVSLILVMRV